MGLALIFQGVLNFGRLLLDKGGRLEAWQLALATTYRDHVILCGLGHVNMGVLTQLLDDGYEVVVVERDWDSEFVKRALALKVPVVLGDARDPAVLRQAGIQRATAVVAGVNGDMINIEIALAARATRPNIRVIVRVFDDELDRNLERNFGVNTVFSASALAAPTFAAAAVAQTIDYVIPLDDTLLGIDRFVIEANGQLGTSIAQIEERCQVRVLHHQVASNQWLARPPRGTLNYGDQLTVIGTLEALERMRVLNLPTTISDTDHASAPQHPTAQFDTVIVCGLGKIGYRVVRQLYYLRPQPRIVVVRLNDETNDFYRHISELEGVKMVIGDARDPEVLLKAGLETAYSVAAVTSNDALNLQIGLVAQRLRPDINMVVRVFSDVLAERFEDLFGIRTTYSTSSLASPTLAAAAVLGDVPIAFTVNRHMYATEQILLHPESRLKGHTIDEVRRQHGLLVVGLRRSLTGVAHIDWENYEPEQAVHVLPDPGGLKTAPHESHPALGTSEDVQVATLEDQRSEDVSASGFTILPSLNTVLAAGDELIVLASLEELRRLRAAKRG
jgi:Trk K+ transport system NAD-binding subunit